jgi:hypothetical protein
MGRTLTGVVIAALLIVAVTASMVWAGDTQIAIIYSNDINGQIDPIG